MASNVSYRAKGMMMDVGSKLTMMTRVEFGARDILYLGFLVIGTGALAACGEIKPNNPREPAQQRAEAKRQQNACGSSRAYHALKGRLFDQAQAGYGGDRANLDMLADYSTLRMESPLVDGRDEALDLTRCSGRLFLDLPPGAERGFGGDRRLQADVHYTAQPAADGSGLVYRLTDAEPIVTRLAGFTLTSVAFRPPPAIDQKQADVAQVEPADVARAELPPPTPVVQAAVEPTIPATRTTPPAERVEPRRATAGGGEGTVRAFYGALRTGDGGSAAAQIIPEKRGSGAFSPAAITRFYGGLAEPIQLIDVQPVSGRAYRVRYRYSAGRSRCNGTAIVRVANRGGLNLIRSIEALNGC